MEKASEDRGIKNLKKIGTHSTGRSRILVIQKKNGLGTEKTRRIDRAAKDLEGGGDVRRR